MKDFLHIPAAELTELGIVDWGYTSETVPRSFEKFKNWLPENGAKLPFMALEKNVKYRSDLKAWWPHARSAVVFLFSYAPAKKALLDEQQFRVAGYALGFDGEDYHTVMKERLHIIGRKLQVKYNLQFRHSHDTEAILERDLAYRAGLGWFGKNALLISRQHGSYFMLGSLIFDQELSLEPSPLSADHCGQCRACIDACPTDAINLETRTVVAAKCISTWTIEDRSAESPAPVGMDQGRGEVFGCDICQDVCPWNQKPIAHIKPQLGVRAREWLKWFDRPYAVVANDVLPLTNRAFLRLTAGTALGRPGRPSFLRTISFWMKKGRE